MNWKVKAFIQNITASLPSKMSYELYFQIQRHFGGLKKPFNPVRHFKEAVSVLKKIRYHGYEIYGKVFFEAGTGRVPLFPIAFWLCGAGKTITIDLNPYMKKELIEDTLFFISKEQDQIKNIFGDFLDKKRFGELLDYGKGGNINQKDLLELCKIEYIAPGDAAESGLDDSSIDYHISNKVYEHIPLDIITGILKDGNRIVSRGGGGGLFINNIDYGDHFSYMDNKISVINFLRYDDKAWERYAGNRYMYMNRARHDDFIELFKAAGHEFIEIEPYRNEEAKRILKEGKIELDKRFKKKGNEVLSITRALFITREKL